jgi:ABC-2 type transport system ATP-binding protein
VLFLDEPTQGLDPQNRATIWEYMIRLRRERGMTLLLSTHAMEEAEALADTVGIIDHGRMVAEGAPTKLVAELGADLIRIVGSGIADGLLDQLRAFAFVDQASYDAETRTLQISAENGARHLADLVTLVAGHADTIEDVAVIRPSLGDVFLKHTGRALRD